MSQQLQLQLRMNIELSQQLVMNIEQAFASLQTANNEKLRAEGKLLDDLMGQQLLVLQTQINELRQELTSLRQEVQVGETKDDSLPFVQAQRSRYAYISHKIIPQFQPSVDPDDIPYEQIAWWKMIFSYIQPNDYERLHLRRLCNMFKAVLKPPPKGKWTEYPHLNHTSIDSLMNRCEQLYEEDPRKAPTIFFIKEGEHEVEGYFEDEYEDEDGKPAMVPYLLITYPMKIIGAGRDKTFITNGGFEIRGVERGYFEEGKNVALKDMTISETSGYGVIATNGLSWLCDSLTITQCGDGVWAVNTKGRLINCVITQCEHSGIFCGEDALIELKGSQTKVDGNATSGYGFGLSVKQRWHFGMVSKIHLLFPLTKEGVSTNNHEGRNYCSGAGTIKTVTIIEEAVDKKDWN